MSDPLVGGGQAGGSTQPPAGLEKHLEMLQAVINRMAGNSFVAKGWSVGAATALVAFAAQVKNPLLTLVALLPTLAFWGIDAYFVGLERRYRKLYDAVREDQVRLRAVPPYLLNPHWLDNHSNARAPIEPGNKPLASPFWTPSVCAVHGSVLVAVLAVTAVLAVAAPRKPEASPMSVEDTVNVRLLPPPARTRTGNNIPPPLAPPSGSEANRARAGGAP